MNRQIFASLCLVLSLLGSADAAWAQYQRGDMPPEERREMRRQMREHWQQPSPGRHEFRPDYQGRRWPEVPPEERRRMREEMREQRRERRGGDEPRW